MSATTQLGPLEREVMEILWLKEQATVRDVVDVLQQRRSIAYTTVMTVMNNLVAKGLLERQRSGKAHAYRATTSRDEFLQKSASEEVSDVLNRYGDLAIARFVEAVARLNPTDLARLQELARQSDFTQENGE